MNAAPLAGDQSFYCEGSLRSRLSSSSDEPLLDFSQVWHCPLDDEDPRLAVKAQPCRQCRALSRSLCPHVSPNISGSQERPMTITRSADMLYQPVNQDDDLPGGQELDGDLEPSHCHGKHKNPDGATRKALSRLTCTAVFCFLFMVMEWVGGYLANSLAIMSDAAHLLSDFGSFLLSIFAIWLSLQPPTRRMTFGYYRAEILAAVTSVLIVWVVTAVLVYLAVERVVHGYYDIDADTMLIVSGLAVLVNIVMGAILHGRCPSLGGHGHSHGLGGHGHSHSHSDHTQNINVRAATVHILGDLLQSLGVLIAAVIIKFKPEYRVADPVCTFLFSAIVMFTTVGVMRDAGKILLEMAPDTIDYSAVLRDLESIDGVVQVHDLNIWSLKVDKHVISVHLARDTGADADQVLRTALALLRLRHGVSNCTVQVEPYHLAMDQCHQCRLPSAPDT